MFCPIFSSDLEAIHLKEHIPLKPWEMDILLILYEYFSNF